ncbi:hypothetical protein FOG50_00490 [Hanseniaspora uvarum]|nr:hypothetical protein FOG50_00490 [Hanseniaspora uvarum]
MPSTRIKYKHISNVISNVDGLIDFAQINRLYKAITILYHRNKNQYKTNFILLLKSIKQFRLLLLKVIILINDKKYDELFTFLKQKYILKKKVLKKTVYQLYNVINNKTFINMALFMITLISDVHNILVVNFLNKIENELASKGLEVRYLNENKFRIMKKLDNIVKKVEPKEEVTFQENVDIGELIEEDIPPIEKEIEVVEKDLTKKKDKKKKKKKKSLIDDIFSGF